MAELGGETFDMKFSTCIPRAKKCVISRRFRTSALELTNPRLSCLAHGVDSKQYCRRTLIVRCDAVRRFKEFGLPAEARSRFHWNLPFTYQSPVDVPLFHDEQHDLSSTVSDPQDRRVGPERDLFARCHVSTGYRTQITLHWIVPRCIS